MHFFVPFSATDCNAGRGFVFLGSLRLFTIFNVCGEDE